MPNSPLYHFLHKRTVTVDDDPTAPRPPTVLSHDLQLLSAFSLQREPITHHTKQFRGTIDYVFVSSHSLRVCGLQQPDESAAKRGIPSETEPSDHLHLLVQLACVGMPTPTGV